MDDGSGPENTNNPDKYPESVQKRVGVILFQNCTPSKNNGINGVYEPHSHERTFSSHPTDHRKTADAHDDPHHLKRFDVGKNEQVDTAKHLSNYDAKFICFRLRFTFKSKFNLAQLSNSRTVLDAAFRFVLQTNRYE